MKATEGIKELFKQETGKPGERPEVISFRTMQFMVGVIALGLPVAVWAGYALLAQHGAAPLSAISEYYYTIMRDVFVGCLFMVALFLFAYKGYPDPKMIVSENIIFNIAGGLCLIVALFSMNMDAKVCDINKPIEICGGLVAMNHREYFGRLHNGAAAILFFILGFVSLFLFTKTDNRSLMTPQKKRHVIIFRVCGAVIWAALTFYLICRLAHVAWPPLLFWVEFVCLEAFGISWLVKAKPGEVFKP